MHVSVVGGGGGVSLTAFEEYLIRQVDVLGISQSETKTSTLKLIVFVDTNSVFIVSLKLTERVIFERDPPLRLRMTTWPTDGSFYEDFTEQTDVATPGLTHASNLGRCEGCSRRFHGVLLNS